MKTMIAKYPGKCRACGQPINPGDSINFYGRGHARHSDCDLESNSNLEHEDERAGFEPGTLANDRRLARRGLNVIRTSGGTFTQNAKGRCEDAPCCGCCTF